eukprot:m.29776 g.29776  ORF g.29776 m.29776 type:complete len:352 (-) comp16157_c0_seq1:104-1159(-)
MLKRFKRKARKGKLDSLLGNVKKKVNPLNEWRKAEKIGEGAMANVFKVVHKQSNITAAGKILTIEHKDDIEEFAIEVDALSKLKHEGIISLLDAYMFNKEFWVVLEICSGGAFDDILIERKTGLLEPQIQCVASQVICAIEHLHEKGIYHRDVKASNLLLATDGCVKLTDFGSCSLNNFNNKKRDSFLGSPYWMSPEVIACDDTHVGKEKPSYDSKADIWSFGITVIELAECDPPWQDLHPMRALIKIVRSPAPTLEDPHAWSDDMYDFVDQCLHKNAHNRFSAPMLTAHPFCDPQPNLKLLLPLLSHSSVEPQSASHLLAQQLHQAVRGNSAVPFGFTSDGDEEEEEFGW